MIDLGDERSYSLYAENFIFKVQDLLRSKPDMEGEALLGVTQELENFVFTKAVDENKPVQRDCVWMKSEAIASYQNGCQKILKTLGSTEDCDWKRTINDGKLKIVGLYNSLMTGKFKHSSPAKPDKAGVAKGKNSKATTVDRTNKKSKINPFTINHPESVIPATQSDFLHANNMPASNFQNFSYGTSMVANDDGDEEEFMQPLFNFATGGTETSSGAATPYEIPPPYHYGSSSSSSSYPPPPPQDPVSYIDKSE